MNDYICINGRKIVIVERDWAHYDGENTPRIKMCPFCGERHLHGGGVDGHRIPHCGSAKSKVDSVTAVDGSILSAENGYWIVDINKP